MQQSTWTRSAKKARGEGGHWDGGARAARSAWLGIIMNVNAVLQPAVQFQHLSQEVRTQNLLQSIKTKEMREPLLAVQNILAQNR